MGVATCIISAPLMQYPIGPGWCYIHRDGVKQCKMGGLLQFREYEGRLPPGPGYRAPFKKLLELCMAVSLQCFCTQP